MKRIIVMLILCCLTLTACNENLLEPLNEEVGTVISSTETTTEPKTQTTTEEPILLSEGFDETLEKYYDYVDNNPQIIMLADHPNLVTGFTDDNIAAFSLILMYNLGYDGNFETGYSKDSFDEVTEKYFGKKIENYNNIKSYIIPETGKIVPSGWSFSKIFMVLKNLEESSDGVKTGIFYTLFYHEGSEWSKDEMKNKLLSGNFDVNNDVYLFEMKFIEKYDENEEMYFQFFSLNELGMLLDEELQEAVPYDASFPQLKQVLESETVKTLKQYILDSYEDNVKVKMEYNGEMEVDSMDCYTYSVYLDMAQDNGEQANYGFRLLGMYCIEKNGKAIYTLTNGDEWKLWNE